MKTTKILAFTMAALLVAGTAFAGPNCKKKKAPADDSAEEGVFEVKTEKEGKCKSKCKGKKDGEASDSEEGVFEVADREGKEAKDGDRPERKGKKGDRRKPFGGMDLTDDQKEQVKEIMSSAREKAMAIMKEAKEAKEAGEEVDRKAIHEKMMEVRKAAFKDVYDNVLNDDQRAKVDERRKEMEERRKDREGKDGESKGDRKRGDREGKGKDKGDDLDL